MVGIKVVVILIAAAVVGKEETEYTIMAWNNIRRK